MGDDSVEENFLRNLDEIASSKEADIGINKQILDYYKQFGYSRDVEQFFLLDTLQNKFGENSGIIKKHLKMSAEKVAAKEKKNLYDASTSTGHAVQECAKYTQHQPLLVLERDNSKQDFEDYGNESDKSIEGVDVNVSINKATSPASSIKRMEWDSLGDVGYGNDQKPQATDLSTLERLALQGHYSNRENLIDNTFGLPVAESSPLNIDLHKRKSKKISKKSALGRITHNKENKPLKIKISREVSFDFESDNKKRIKTKELKNVSQQEQPSTQQQHSVTKSSSDSHTSNIDDIIQQGSLPLKLQPKYRIKKMHPDKKHRRSKSSSSQKSSNAVSLKTSWHSGTQVSRADSFEYVPGDMYAESKASQEIISGQSQHQLSTESSSNSQKSDASFAHDLAKNIAMLKKILERRHKDSEIRKCLIKKVVTKLVERKYKSDDSVSDFLSELTFESKKIGLEQKILSSLRGTSSSFSSKSKYSTSQSPHSNLLSSRSEGDVTEPLVNEKEKSKSLENLKGKLVSDTSTTSDELFAQYLRALKREKNIESRGKSKDCELKIETIKKIYDKQKKERLENKENIKDKEDDTKSSEISLSNKLKTTPATLALEKLLNREHFSFDDKKEKRKNKQKLEKDEVVQLDAETCKSLPQSRSVGDSSLLKSTISVLTSTPQIMEKLSGSIADAGNKSISNEIQEECIEKKSDVIAKKIAKFNSESPLPSSKKYNTFPFQKEHCVQCKPKSKMSFIHHIAKDAEPKLKSTSAVVTTVDGRDTNPANNLHKEMEKMSFNIPCNMRKTDFFEEINKNAKDVVTFIVLDSSEKINKMYRNPLIEKIPAKATQTHVSINPKKLQPTLDDINIYGPIIKEPNTDAYHICTTTKTNKDNARNIYEFDRLGKFKKAETINELSDTNCDQKNIPAGVQTLKEPLSCSNEAQSSTEESSEKDIIIELIKQIARKYKKDKKLKLDRQSSTSEKYVKLILDSMQYLLGTDSDCDICIIDDETRTYKEKEKPKRSKVKSEDQNKILETSYDSHKSQANKNSRKYIQRNVKKLKKVRTQQDPSETLSSNTSVSKTKICSQSEGSDSQSKNEDLDNESSGSPKELVKKLENTYMRPEVLTDNKSAETQIQVNNVSTQDDLNQPNIIFTTKETRPPVQKPNSVAFEHVHNKESSNVRLQSTDSNDRQHGTTNEYTQKEDIQNRDEKQTIDHRKQTDEYYSKYQPDLSGTGSSTSSNSDSSDRSIITDSSEDITPANCPYYKEYIHRNAFKFEPFKIPTPENVCHFGICPHWERYHRFNHQPKCFKCKVGKYAPMVMRPATVEQHRYKHTRQTSRHQESKYCQHTENAITKQKDVKETKMEPNEADFNDANNENEEISDHSNELSNGKEIKNNRDFVLIKRNTSVLGINAAVQTKPHLGVRSPNSYFVSTTRDKAIGIQTDANDKKSKDKTSKKIAENQTKHSNFMDRKKVAFTREKYVGLAFCKCPSPIMFEATYPDKDISCESSTSSLTVNDNICQTDAHKISRKTDYRKLSPRKSRNYAKDSRKPKEIPKPIAYNLILEPSDSILVDREHNDPKILKDVVVKVPHRRISRPEMVDYNCNFFASQNPGPSSYEPPPSREGDANLCVRNYLEINRPDFFENVKKREEYIKKSHKLRLLRQSAKRQILSLLGQEGITEVDAEDLRELARQLSIQIPSKYFMDRRKVITEDEMKRHSNRIYQRLPEVQKKREVQSKEAQRNSNLIMAGLYRKMLQQKVLKGDVNIPHSRSIVKL